MSIVWTVSPSLASSLSRSRPFAWKHPEILMFVKCWWYYWGIFPTWISTSWLCWHSNLESRHLNCSFSWVRMSKVGKLHSVKINKWIEIFKYGLNDLISVSVSKNQVLISWFVWRYCKWRHNYRNICHYQTALLFGFNSLGCAQRYKLIKRMTLLLFGNENSVVESTKMRSGED